MIKNDAQMITALLSTRTLREAAARVGVSERTLSRRLEDRAFKEKLNAASVQAIGWSMAPLPRHLDRALQTVAACLDSEDERIRLRAVEIIFTQAFRYIDVMEFDERLRRQEELAGIIMVEKGAKNVQAPRS